MFPLEPGAIDRLIQGEPLSHRTTALRHASIHNRPGLMGDDPLHPSSVVWLRPGDDGGWEAFASGDPGPSLDWITEKAQGATVALLAPEFWADVVRGGGAKVGTATIRTFLHYDLMRLPRFSKEPRVLKREDASEFEKVAPAWALRSWSDFDSMIDRGLALGLVSTIGFVSIAWTYESDLGHDKIGVATLPPYQSLGLGRRVAGALIERVVNDRRKAPVWVTTPENAASIALARSLGFANSINENLIRWTP
jgi:RimJ/RimL family protein N-acetyltransferase